ncbi:MAG: phosphate acyltransferase PlsX [Spirosomaceae bacterium]|jgi:phosphate acyltransferase|nr:phosphate acyltransferase PlsX [Spirosomataceae bacterium]
MNIGIDAMGGDFAPEAIVQGAVMAVENLPPDVTLTLVGKQEVVSNLLHQYDYSGSQIKVVHAEEVVEMGEHPTKAFSQKPHSSISIGFKLLKDKQIDIFCGAGNTGAMHVGALFSIKSIEGIIRPAIAGFVPQKKGGYAVMLDIGANADCKPEVLEQFGVIGSIFAQNTFGIDKPRVALMNIGEEEQKGSVIAQAAHQLLKSNPRIHFVGNMEGGDFFDDKADVIVTDGFTGNALFKLAESFYDVAKERGIQDPYIDKMNYEAVGGSPIIGVNGNVMIAHGISTPLAIKNMIGWAKKQVESQAYVQIAKALN